MGSQEVWSFSDKEACETCPTTSIYSWNSKSSQGFGDHRTMIREPRRVRFSEALPNPCISHGHCQVWGRLIEGALHAVTWQGDSWLRNRRCKPPSGYSPTSQYLRAEGIPWKGSYNYVGEVNPGVCRNYAIRPSVQV